jgi:hypothetical protein
MGSPRHRFDFEQSPFLQLLEDFKIGFGLSGLFCFYGHAGTVFDVPSDGPREFSCFLRHLPPNKPEIDLFHFSFPELTLELDIGRECFGHDHNSRSFLVQAMDDPRSFFGAHTFQFRNMKEECTNQGVLFMSGPGMDNLAGGLVHDRDVFILVEENNRQGLRLEILRFGCTEINGNGFPLP